MFELIGGFVAIGFAWVMLAVMMFPWVVLIESGGSKYIRYASNGEVDVPNFFGRFWDKWLSTSYESNSWVYRNDFEPWMIIAYVVAIGFMGAATGCHFDNTSAEMTVISFMTYALFGSWVAVGTFLAPVLTVGAAVVGVTYVSRKSFAFKSVLTSHMNDKKIHK